MRTFPPRGWLCVCAYFCLCVSGHILPLTTRMFPLFHAVQNCDLFGVPCLEMWPERVASLKPVSPWLLNAVETGSGGILLLS